MEPDAGVKMETIVLGLGGNALMDPSKEEIAQEMHNAQRIACEIAKLDLNNIRLIVTHGNGPQVGEEVLRNIHARRHVRPLPLHLMTAETQATIGSVLELAIAAELRKRKIDKSVSVVLTHVAVSSKDTAFSRPTKPVGPIYTKRELEHELKNEKFRYVRMEEGYRRVVPSPKPLDVIEAKQIREYSRGGIVIACGGGGIPVTKFGGTYGGANAVVDKDRTTGLLATLVHADKLVLLTDVDYVYTRYPKGKPIRSASAEMLHKRINTFEEGTMRPKISACIAFVRNTRASAFIGKLDGLADVLDGTSGTRIYR